MVQRDGSPGGQQPKDAVGPFAPGHSCSPALQQMVSPYELSRQLSQHIPAFAAGPFLQCCCPASPARHGRVRANVRVRAGIQGQALVLRRGQASEPRQYRWPSTIGRQQSDAQSVSVCCGGLCRGMYNFTALASRDQHAQMTVCCGISVLVNEVVATSAGSAQQ